MKILFSVHQFFPRHYTGTERVVLNLAKQMQKMGHEICVLTYETVDRSNMDARNDMMLRKYAFQGVPVISVRHKNQPGGLEFCISIPDKEDMMGSILEDGRYDLLHVFHPMRVGSVVESAARRNIPIIMTLTDFWLICPRFIMVTPKNELCFGPEDGTKCTLKCFDASRKLELENRFRESCQMVKRVKEIVSPTKFLGSLIEKNLHIKPRIIPFGQEFRNFKSNQRIYSEKSTITMAFLSTLLPHKGAHVLLEAFNKANADNVWLKLYGDNFGNNEYLLSLKALVKSPERVAFCGRYKEEDLPEILRSIDVVVIPSIWWENSPLILLRALSHKVPVIVSNLAGLTEIVKDGINGFSFTAGDPNSLAEIIKRISSDQMILNQIKVNIQILPRIEEEALEYEKLYNRYVNSKTSNLIHMCKERRMEN